MYFPDVFWDFPLIERDERRRNRLAEPFGLQTASWHNENAKLIILIIKIIKLSLLWEILGVEWGKEI